MENIVTWIIIGILAAMILGYVIFQIVKITKMNPVERKAVLVSYLVSLVNAAEEEIGSGHGAEKLRAVEDWFKTKAPLFYKMALMMVGKENLKELIEEALAQIKKNFGK